MTGWDAPSMIYIGLAVIYVLLLVVLGVKSFQKRHYVLFGVGFIFPVLWIVGAMLPRKGMSHIDDLYADRDGVG